MSKYDGVPEWVQIAQEKIEAMTKEEIIKFAEKNPPTFKESYGTIEKMDLGLHTTDDQGFEGQVISRNGKKSYHRWVNDDIEEWKIQIELEEKDDYSLEESWQTQCSLIKNYLTEYYASGNEELRKKAIEAQWKQSKIQDEITRRH